MPIEGGPRPESRPSRRIEGESIRPFSEIQIDQADPVRLVDMSWSEHAAGLSFQLVGGYEYRRHGYDELYPLYKCTSWYKGYGSKSQRIDLTYTTRNKRCLFTGSRNGFFMHDPFWMGKDKDFYVIGINPYELEGDIRQHAGTYHELGHACIVDRGFDISLFSAAMHLSQDYLPPVAMALAYGQVLAGAIPENWRENLDQREEFDGRQLINAMVDDYDVDIAVRLFHERNAWAGGIRLQDAHGFPTGFNHKGSLGEYARFWLDIYARVHSDPRFVKGLKSK